MPNGVGALLVRDYPQLLNSAAEGTFTLHIQVDLKTGEGEHRLQFELPREGAIRVVRREAQAFTIGKEPVYWAAF